MKLPARELDATHLGNTVTVTHNGTTITGPLQAVTHESDLIDDTSWGDQGVTKWVRGRPRTCLTILEGHRIEVPHNAEVEVRA